MLMQLPEGTNQWCVSSLSVCFQMVGDWKAITVSSQNTLHIRRPQLWMSRPKRLCYDSGQSVDICTPLCPDEWPHSNIMLYTPSSLIHRGPPVGQRSTVLCITVGYATLAVGSGWQEWDGGQFGFATWVHCVIDLSVSVEWMLMGADVATTTSACDLSVHNTLQDYQCETRLLNLFILILVVVGCPLSHHPWYNKYKQHRHYNQSLCIK